MLPMAMLDSILKYMEEIRLGKKERNSNFELLRIVSTFFGYYESF